MSKSTQKTSAYYEDAIEELRFYRAREPDKKKRDEAKAKIRKYRLIIIDDAFDNIANRTQHLTTLMNDLQAIIANASKNDALSDAIGGLTDIVTEVSSIVNPSDDNNDNGDT